MPETIKTYVEKNNAAWDQVGTSVDRIVASFQGVQGDIQFLKDTITKLQNNPGPISAEDQALLDAGVPRAEQALSRAQGVADALAALDESTAEPPVEEPPVDGGGTPT